MDELFNLFYDKEYQERLGRALYPWAFPPEDPLSGADGAVRGSDIELKPRSCGMTGHREGCTCGPKDKVDNE